MSLIDKTYLCYISTKSLKQWIKEKNLFDSNFSTEKEKWQKEISYRTSFFSNTEFLLKKDNSILLKTFSDNQNFFLAKTYQLEYQNVCQKIFREKLDIFLITEKKWEGISKFSYQEENNEEIIVLFKDKETIEKCLTDWIKRTLES